MASTGEIKAGAAYIEIFLKDGKLVTGLHSAQKKLKAFSESVGTVGRTLFAASAAAATPILLSAKTFADFSDQMAIVRAVTDSTDQQFSALNDRAKELGRTTSFTATEVASAMVALGKAGFSSNEILASIAGTLDLARAGALGLEDATGIMADVTRSFGLTADAAEHVGDVLAKTANISNTDVPLIGESMKYVASSANLSGQSLEKVSAALAVLANRGLKGEMAGASLAMALTQLSSDAGRKELAALGVTVSDDAGNMRDLIDIVDDLSKATAGMGNAHKLALFSKVFDQRGMRSMIMLSKNTAEWKEYSKVLHTCDGTAAKVAKQMDNTLGGSFRMLMSAVEGVQIAIGEALDKTLRGWMDRAAEVANKVTTLIDANRGLVVSAVKIIAIVGAVGSVLIAVGTAGAGLAFVIGGLASLITGAATVVGVLCSALGALLSPLGLVAAAVVGLALYIIYCTDAGSEALDWLGEKFQSLKDKVSKVVGAMGDALAAGNLSLAARILWLAIKLEWQKGINYINTLWETLVLVVKNTFDQIITLAINTADGFYTAFRNAIDSIYKLILGISEFIAKAFWSAIQKVVEGFASTLQALLGAGYILHIFDENEVAEFDKKIREMRDAGKGFTDDRKKEVEDFYQGKIGEADKRQQERNQELNDRMFGREQDRSGRDQGRDDAYKKDIQTSQAELDKARKEWNDAVAQAKKEHEDYGGKSPEAPGILDKLKSKLSEAGDATAGAVQRTISAQGIFSPAALLSLQGAGTAERTARASEETAKNTKRLVDATKTGGLTFT